MRGAVADQLCRLIPCRAAGTSARAARHEYMYLGTVRCGGVQLVMVCGGIFMGFEGFLFGTCRLCVLEILLEIPIYSLFLKSRFVE